MILAFRCNCGGSENLIRRALEANGYKGWATLPIPVGGEAALVSLSSLSLPDNMEIRSLKRFLKTATKYAIILGVKGGVARWANLSDGTPTSKLDAKAIIEKLA